ncbi:hypothetical protein G5B40_15085 [Pikeienuella piscinae]|uniref:Uncharacterized protein n=1 Tax=Pikeienuella piscinae TaxID=2748098 RepID=A0A7L5BW57_9RHOB|nr:hypothetical protein [Pikeienuella piscinae]QIE56640.1 hypothetical protein G5B40_15085 [Pikeienuella piscinae]
MPDRRPDPTWNLDVPPAADPVPYDESLVNDDAFDTEDLPTLEAVFGPAFLHEWSSRLEAERRPTVKTPVTPERLAERLAGLAFIAEAFATLSAPEPDGVHQMSDDQRRAARRHLENTRRAFDGYLAFRRALSDEFGSSLLPSGEDVDKALSSLKASLEHVEVRPRARGHYELLVKDVRVILKQLTGNTGRVVDRETGVESGLLFDFSLALIERLAPGIDPTAAATRIRTAIRARR